MGEKKTASQVYHCEDFTKTIECQRTTGLKAGNADFHMHSGYEIYMLLDGQIHYFVEQSCYPMEAGNIIIFNHQEIHKATNLTNRPFSRLVLHLNPTFVRQYCTNKTNLLSCFQNRRAGQNNMIALPPEQAAVYYNLFHRLADLWESDEYGSDVLAVSYLIQILVFINQHYETQSLSSHTILHRAQPIMTYIDSHLTETLTLEGIAKSLNMDKYYISHLFKKETENTIFQYILVKRISLAKELLSDGRNVTDACQGAGFNDYSNFIRSFRQITGMTPGQYRKSVNSFNS